MTTKICSKCSETKDISEFGKRNDTLSGYHGQCKICLANHKRNYRKNNIKHVTAHKKKYYIDNKENIINAVKEYTDSNKEKVTKRRKNYRKNNPDKIHSDILIRKESRKQALPVWYESEREEIKQLYIERNQWKEYGIDAHVDHIVPLKHPLVCGLHSIANLQILPAYDNLSKNNTFEIT